MTLEQLSDQERLKRNEEYLKQPGVREELFRQFAPTFYYHKEENSFPLHPDVFVQNVIEAKYEEYTNIRTTQKRVLEPLEAKELDIITRYFWKDGKFNPNYGEHAEQPDFKEMMQPANGSNSRFLVFDEKKYGYKVGSKINITGDAPPDHPKHNGKEPPIVASIIPTQDGFFVQYEYTYPFNAPIKGMGWLRNLLPSKMADKFDNFGLHYGDCEGVGMYVNMNDNGTVGLKSMQTFAHGRGFAREVPVEDCTIGKDGRASVFVGLGGHPSYADNFVGRNKVLDVVGDKYKLTPNKFIDISPDIEKSKIPPSLAHFPRLAESNPMLHSDICHPKNEAELKDQSKEWRRYEPVLFITKAWNKIKSVVKSLLGHKEERHPTPSFDLENFVRPTSKERDAVEMQKALGQAPIVTHSINKPKSWTEEIGTKEERARDIEIQSMSK